ncbi:hypothetical protein ABZ801_16215 [Actinomadura sp. NPDC047616]|uniref:hypothetical protein n=1 Tax=Actinomadura sp. NPDC047616 TaxID=3155914 RepID=UPI0033FD531B
MTDHSGDEPSRFEQHNHGSGAFIGRDNYGTINAIDKTTQAILEKLSKEAPALARLLRKALQDGVVSPDVVHALEVAARNINEDVAHALWTAGRNINEDVAITLLQAGTKISEAGNLDRIATRMESALERFEAVSVALNSMSRPQGRNSLMGQLEDTVDSIRLHADRIEGVVTPPPAQVVVAWKPTFYAFIFGLVAGMILLALIVNR